MISTEKRRQVSISIDPLSEEAPKTIQWANENFIRPNDIVHAIMVSVMDPEYIDQGCIEIPPTDSFNELIRNEAEARELLFKNLLKPLIKEEGVNIQVERHILKSDPSHACQTLIDFVNEEGVDCLIMGSRNLSGWKRFFLGSFSHHVQSNVNCPVLIVK